MFAFETFGEGAAIGPARFAHDGLKSFSHGRAVFSLAQALAGAEPLDASAVVELVEANGADELRNAGGESGGGGADAAVMQDGGAEGKEFSKGDEGGVEDSVRECTGQLIAKSGEEDPAPTEPGACFGGLPEQRRGMGHAGAEGESNGRGTAGAKFGECWG